MSEHRGRDAAPAVGPQAAPAAAGDVTWDVTVGVNNHLVLLTATTLFLTYLVCSLALFVWRWRGCLSPLYVLSWPPKDIGASYPYIVTVVTGSRKGAGTSGTVKLTLTGRQAASNLQVIRGEIIAESGLALLGRSASIDFLLIADEPLGDIQFAVVELSTPQEYESWYLSYISVCDVRAGGVQSYLPLHRWLVATNNGGEQMVLMPPRNNSIEHVCDNIWRCLRELHIWTATWSSTLMSGRLDAFFSLSLAHALVAAVLFAAALSFYAPVAPAIYSQLVSFAALIYWALILVIVTVFTGTIQMSMRMVRVGSRQLLQRYRRVGVVLANPHPADRRPSAAAVAARQNSLPMLAPPTASVANNNASGSNNETAAAAAASWWSKPLRRLTELTRRSANNSQNNSNSGGNDKDDLASRGQSGFARSVREGLAALWRRSLARTFCRQSRSSPTQDDLNNNNNDKDGGGEYDSDSPDQPQFTRSFRRGPAAVWKRSSPPSSTTIARSGTLTDHLNRLKDRFAIFDDTSSLNVRYSLVPVDDDEDRIAELESLPASTWSSSSAAARVTGDEFITMMRTADLDDHNVNNNNNDKKAGEPALVSVTVQTSNGVVGNVNSSGPSQPNWSSNAGDDEVPKRRSSASRRSSAANARRSSSSRGSVAAGSGDPTPPARRASAMRTSASPHRSTGVSITEPPAAPRLSSASVANPEPRRSTDAPRKSTDRKSVQELMGQAPAEPRSSSAAAEPRTSATRLSTESKRSSTGQAVEEARSSTTAAEPAIRLSAGQAMPSKDGRRTSATDEPRRSSAAKEARKSTSGKTELEPRRHPTRGQSASLDAARRSLTAGSVGEPAGHKASQYPLDKMDWERAAGRAASGRPSSTAGFRCAVSPCPSCCAAGVRPHTCWCRCAHEIHYPDPLDDCCGARDGRLLSLPGFPSGKIRCNSCFTPCKPLASLSREELVCEPKCRFDSCCECPSASAHKSGSSGGLLGNIRSKLSGSPSAKSTSRGGGSVGNRPSFASTAKSPFSRRSSAIGNVSRNNPMAMMRASQPWNFPRALAPQPAFRSSSAVNTSTHNRMADSSSVFELHWNKLWDEIVPDGEDQTAQRQPASSFDGVRLSELKTFTGRLIETVVSRLKAHYSRSSSANNSATGGETSPFAGLSQADVEALCRNIIHEMRRDDHVTSASSRDQREPAIMEMVEPSDASETGETASTHDEDDDDDDDDDDDLRSQLLLDDSCLRDFAAGVVEGLYSALRRRLDEADGMGPEDDNQNCSNVAAYADAEIRSHVLPAVVDQIVWMIKQELRKSGGDVRKAADKYVDTIVTNAVLSVRGRLDARDQDAVKSLFVISNDPTGYLNDNRSNRSWSQRGAPMLSRTESEPTNPKKARIRDDDTDDDDDDDNSDDDDYDYDSDSEFECDTISVPPFVDATGGAEGRPTELSLGCSKNDDEGCPPDCDCHVQITPPRILETSNDCQTCKKDSRHAQRPAKPNDCCPQMAACDYQDTRRRTPKCERTSRNCGQKTRQSTEKCRAGKQKDRCPHTPVCSQDSDPCRTAQTGSPHDHEHCPTCAQKTRECQCKRTTEKRGQSRTKPCEHASAVCPYCYENPCRNTAMCAAAQNASHDQCQTCGQPTKDWVGKERATSKCKHHQQPMPPTGPPPHQPPAACVNCGQDPCRKTQQCATAVHHGPGHKSKARRRKSSRHSDLETEPEQEHDARRCPHGYDAAGAHGSIAVGNPAHHIPVNTDTSINEIWSNHDPDASSHPGYNSPSDADENDEVWNSLLRRENETVESYLIRSILLLGNLANQSNSAVVQDASRQVAASPIVAQAVQRAVNTVNNQAHSSGQVDVRSAGWGRVPDYRRTWSSHGGTSPAPSSQYGASPRSSQQGESPMTAWLRAPYPGRSRFVSNDGGRYSGNRSTYASQASTYHYVSSGSGGVSARGRGPVSGSSSFNTLQYTDNRVRGSNAPFYRDGVSGQLAGGNSFSYRSNRRTDRERFGSRDVRPMGSSDSGSSRFSAAGANFNMHSNQPGDGAATAAADAAESPTDTPRSMTAGDAVERNTNNSRLPKAAHDNADNSNSNSAVGNDDKDDTKLAARRSLASVDVTAQENDSSSDNKPCKNNDNNNNNNNDISDDCNDPTRQDDVTTVSVVAPCTDEFARNPTVAPKRASRTRRWPSAGRTGRSRAALAAVKAGRRSTAALKAVSCSALEVDAFLRQLDADRLHPDVELLARVLDQYRAAIGLPEADALAAWPAAWRLAQLPVGHWVVSEVLGHAREDLARYSEVKASAYCRARSLTVLGLSVLGGVDDDVTARVVDSVSVELEEVILKRAIGAVVRLLVDKMSLLQHGQLPLSKSLSKSANGNANKNANATVRFDDAGNPESDFTTSEAEGDPLMPRPLVPRSDPDDPPPQSLPPSSSSGTPPLDLYTLSQVLTDSAPDRRPTSSVLGVVLLALVLVLLGVFGLGYVVLGARLNTPTAWSWLYTALVVFVVHAAIFDPLRIVCIAFYWTTFRHQLLP